MMGSVMDMSNTPSSTHGAGEIAAHSEHDAHAAEHIHMPSPSFSPIVLALGLAFISFGLAFGAVILIIGVIITAIGLGTWILDDIRSASAQPPEH